MNFGFRWVDENGGGGQELAFRSTDDFTMARVLVPNVQKIPVYVYSEFMDEASNDYSFIFIDTVNLRSKFRDFDYPVSRLATNLNNDFKDNFGCSAWFQFRFYGFIEGFEDGIDDDGDIERLPPGITVVPQISWCGGYKIEGVDGCATLDGARIAIARNVFNLTSDETKEVVVTLHEIAHTSGLDHVEDSDPDNLMRSPTVAENVAIREDQCRAISVGKSFVTPDPWEQ